MSINIYYAISNKLLISDIMVVSMNTVKEKDGFGNRKFLNCNKIIVIYINI